MFATWFNLGMLAVEAQQVVALRLLKLAGGGTGAYEECHVMVGEKVSEALASAAKLRDGASIDSVVTAYRSVVRANASRLTTLPPRT